MANTRVGGHKMLSMEPSGGGSRGTTDAALAPPSISVRIVRTEEQTSIIMQRFTAYIIEVCDFGRTSEVAHRYGDFETLHRAVATECMGTTLPPMPPKGMDGTDMAVVAKRKVELEKLLRFMLQAPEVLQEKTLNIWKFLNLSNPAVIAGRFVLVPRGRGSILKTLTKLCDPKYKDDVYRLAHPSITDVLFEALRELRGGSDNNHWCRQSGGRNAICSLLAAALGATEACRARLIEADVVSLLLGVVEREEGALDDCRLALNVVVAREAERFPALFATFLCRGGMSQLAVLAQRPKCQEFVAKLLWLAWDAPTRRPFAQRDGQGLKLLKSLLASTSPTCALLGAVLLAGLVAHNELDSDYRASALEKVRELLEKPEGAEDPQFTKTLCGANAVLVRLAGLLEDPDLTPLILGLLCAARPPAAKLSPIAGNLANLVGDRGNSVHSEETRARAAELLLHIQGSPASGGEGPASGPATTLDLENCEGIADHEEALDKAMRWQLEEALVKSGQALEASELQVLDVRALGAHRLQTLPALDFGTFERSLTSFKAAREGLDKFVNASARLHADMLRQLQELQTAQPAVADEQLYKDRLVTVERLYAEVKSQREALAVADAQARQTQGSAEGSAQSLKRAAEELKCVEDEVNGLRVARGEKETDATKLRHKANTPNIEQMKQQASASLERNAAQVKELQVIGQRVQQGDPDYLKEGESRESKINELAAKLTSLKKQHQALLQQQKELDFDPVEMGRKASQLEAEAAELESRASALEARRSELERQRAELTGSASRDSAEAKAAQERRSSIASRLQSTEAEARSKLSALRPLIQEHHAVWQRLIGKQKKLDSDHASLGNRLADARAAAAKEASSRAELASSVQGLVEILQGLQSFLTQVGTDPSPAAHPQTFAMDEAPPALVPASAAAAGSAPSLSSTAPAAATTAASGGGAALLDSSVMDEFDAFLSEGVGSLLPTTSAGTAGGGGTTAPVGGGDVFGADADLDDDILFGSGPPVAAPAAESAQAPAPALVPAAAPEPVIPDEL